MHHGYNTYYFEICLQSSLFVLAASSYRSESDDFILLDICILNPLVLNSACAASWDARLLDPYDTTYGSVSYGRSCTALSRFSFCLPPASRVFMKQIF